MRTRVWVWVYARAHACVRRSVSTPNCPHPGWDRPTQDSTAVCCSGDMFHRTSGRSSVRPAYGLPLAATNDTTACKPGSMPWPPPELHPDIPGPLFPGCRVLSQASFDQPWGWGCLAGWVHVHSTPPPGRGLGPVACRLSQFRCYTVTHPKNRPPRGGVNFRCSP